MKFILKGFIDLVRLLKDAGLAKSHAEAKRLIKQGAVEIDGVKATHQIIPWVEKGGK